MPTYAYRCPHCGHAFERREKMSAAAAHCPQCDVPAEREITGGAGVLVRGAAVAAPPPAGPSSCCGGGACGLN